jgi:hypothetical protein
MGWDRGVGGGAWNGVGDTYDTLCLRFALEAFREMVHIIVWVIWTGEM